jgi:3-methyladenine DNA glycosylase AlkD
MNTLEQLHHDLRLIASPERARSLAWFFKARPGQYGEGDQFLGIRVPDLRRVARKYRRLDLKDSELLLRSHFHEERLLALFILAEQFRKGGSEIQNSVYNLYLLNTDCINNWDLVDCSAEHIVGGWLERRDRSQLTEFAASETVWERRIAIMSTFHYIKKGDHQETIRIAELLVKDKHDLIQKAVGWMLREVGKRCSVEAEEAFLDAHHKQMPRTMLRYAIERFPQDRRAYYMKRS